VTGQSGCKTIGNVVDCSNLGLVTIPDFTSGIPNPGGIVEVNLDNNNIRVLHAHAFDGIAPTTINLERNRIDSIDDNAFKAVYTSLTTLKLRNNKLAFMPAEIGKLTMIMSLDIKDNDVTQTSLDAASDNVFRQIGDTLKEFHFGGRNFAVWPNVALSHFQKLELLDYEGGYLSFIPYGGFHGFEHTLHKFFISKTRLRQLPIGISTLQELRELHFNDNTLVGDFGILAQAFATTTHTNSPLLVLSLQNDGLSRFPAVLRNLVNLQELYMNRNKLWYVADNAVNLLKQSQLTKMGLSGCNLDRIPQALLQLESLTNLDVSANNIQSIERFDMSNHTKISLLNVSGNPLAYISTEALKDLPKLHKLDFSNTSMTQIPKAILNTHALTTLNLKNCRIECTCDLTWISKQLNVTRIIFEGTCETIEKPISLYIKDRVPTCPAR
jgi:Leucine-rich repeat (LRR) protein